MASLAETSKSAEGLSPQQEEFARLYYAGPEGIRGNATRAYLAAYYPDDPASYSPEDREYKSASANSSRLLRREKIRARIREIREEAGARAKMRARSWWELYPDAQRVLWAAVTGKWDDLPAGPWDDEGRRSAVKAAEQIIDRCEGTVRQVHDHRVRGGITVEVAGPDHSGAERAGEEEEEALRSGPRYIETEATEGLPNGA